MLGLCDARLAELALWERRWTDAQAAIDAGLARARRHEAAQIRLQLCATGLARACGARRSRRRPPRRRRHPTRARGGRGTCSLLLAVPQQMRRRSPPTPTAGSPWPRRSTSVSAGSRGRSCGPTLPDVGPPRTPATCGLLPLAPGGGPRRRRRLSHRGDCPAQEAFTVAARIGAKPLSHELELLAQHARLDLAAPHERPDERHTLAETLGLTAREAEVLNLVARGYTNREIATTLIISAKTASVHVTHILHKLGVPNRQEAAAIAHRLTPPPAGNPNSKVERTLPDRRRSSEPWLHGRSRQPNGGDPSAMRRPPTTLETTAAGKRVRRSRPAHRRRWSVLRARCCGRASRDRRLDARVPSGTFPGDDGSSRLAALAHVPQLVAAAATPFGHADVERCDVVRCVAFGTRTARELDRRSPRPVPRSATRYRVGRRRAAERHWADADHALPPRPVAHASTSSHPRRSSSTWPRAPDHGGPGAS